MKYILGISAFYHDSSASLIADGEIVSAVQEERFTRKKHDASFPTKSIEYIISEANISLLEIDSIIFYEKPFLKFERLIETYVDFAPSGFSSFCLSMPLWIKEKLFQKNIIYIELKKIDNRFKSINKIKFSEHHLSHAASAFYPSPFREAAIITIDGVGEWATTTISIGRKNKIKVDKEIHFPHSLGLLYSAFTYYLGFKVNSGEYKIMGLAPYGKPIFKDLILEKLITLHNDGSFELDMSYFNYATGLTMINSKFVKLFGQKIRQPEKESINQFHMDIAASIQSVIELAVIKICVFVRDFYNVENVCLAGGVALNCVSNGKILKKKIFKNMWIQPASGDAGGSLGAALNYWYNELNNERVVRTNSMKGSKLGPKFDGVEIEQSLNKLGAVFTKLDNEKLLDKTVDEIILGKAIGWFKGRMEFGPRALGNRSIIADPRSDKIHKDLNIKIKFRETFRPFASAVLRNKVSDYFEINVDSPYMLLVANIKEKVKISLNDEQKKLFGMDLLNVKRSTLPAITHVDYSSRIQTVTKEIDNDFYDLIEKFYARTGCAVLINTSFNIRGEPIVCSVEDAFRCFMGTDLDILVIENFFLYKKLQNKNLINKHYKDTYELD